MWKKTLRGRCLLFEYKEAMKPGSQEKEGALADAEKTKGSRPKSLGSDQTNGLKIFAKVKNKDRFKGLEGYFGYRKSEFKRIYLK